MLSLALAVKRIAVAVRGCHQRASGVFSRDDPYGTGQGQAFCGPDDSQRQSPPRPLAPQWVDRFGAIATDGPGESFGASTDMPSRASADDAALLDCRSKKGSATCEIEISYWDQCAAMVAGHSGYNTKAGVTVDLAIETAMKVQRRGYPLSRLLHRLQFASADSIERICHDCLARSSTKMLEVAQCSCARCSRHSS